MIQLTDREINAYQVYMGTEYVPRRLVGDTRAFSKISAKYLDIVVRPLHVGE